MNDLWIQLFIGTIMIIFTVISHAILLDKLMRNVKKLSHAFSRLFKSSWKTYFISFVVLYVFISHIIQIWMWAWLYLEISDELNTLEQALYFSTSSFTTVGFGDLVLNEQWRMLSTIEAANGFLLFGWSTAFIFEIILQIYRRESKDLERESR